MYGNVTNAYRQVHFLYAKLHRNLGQYEGHKCLSASTFTVPDMKRSQYKSEMSQMPIGKYIYCTPTCGWLISREPTVTNAYRQVHLLYPKKGNELYWRKASQMPIGKYIYCTLLGIGFNYSVKVTNAYRQVHLLYP